MNEEVQQDTENIGAGAAMERLLPQQACGNDEWNAPPKQDASLQKVQNSGDQAAHRDSQKSVRLLERVTKWPSVSERSSCRIFDHSMASLSFGRERS